MDLMCFFFEDREFKNPELWSGTQSDRIFAASLRARPCAITPGDKPGSMRAGQSTTSALKLDTVQGWSGVVEFSSLYSAESLHKFQPKCWIVFAYTAANNGTLYKSHESSEHTASNSRQSILKIWVPQSSPVLSFSLTQSVTLSFTVLGLRGGLCMRSWRNSLQLVKKTIPCHNSCLLFVAMTIFKTCMAWDQEQKTSHLQLKPQDCYVNTLSQIQYSAIQDGINIPRVPSLFRFASKNLGPRKG